MSADLAMDPLAALRRRYAGALPGRVRSLARAVAAWRRSPGDAGRRDRASRLAHRLRGTAGSYGFADVSAALGAVEDALRAALGEPPRADTRAPDAVEEALRAARETSARAAGRPRARKADV